jgi:Cu(I)/Ag(I) efflux system membrane fusion protein/cobalt-zinc-cadmium efflux system membrane fusion protein
MNTSDSPDHIDGPVEMSNHAPETDRYRRAFQVTLVACVALGVVAGTLAWRLGRDGRLVAGGSGAAAPSTMSAPPMSGMPADTGATDSPRPQEPVLHPIQLSPQRLMSIGVRMGTVEIKPVSQEIRAVGNVVVDERRLSTVQLRFAGWIRTVYVDATYDYVRQGQPLFTIYSPDLVTTEREYLVAKKNREALASSAVPGVAEGAEAVLDAAVARLRQWNLPQREIERLQSTGEVREDLEIDAPASGYIIERNALPNSYVQPQTHLYTVADLSSVWVIGEFFQSDIGQFKAGQPAMITTDAYPGRIFRGRVDQVYPQVDTTTRTVKIRFVFSNPDLKLTPGMFVNVTAIIPMGRQLVLPASGVLHSGMRNIVFIDHGQGYLEPREVEVGTRVGDEVIALKGVQAGDRVVTSANFLIDSESQLQAALGSFAPPPPGAGAAAAMNAPAAAATIALTTDPSPPRKGANTLRVQVKDGSGAPLAGARGSVSFFMEAMPAMGMAEMRATADLTESGAGTYGGELTLASGGTWQVTVVAQKEGRTVAQQQVSLTATGGM